jgi:hypothetical protein
MPELPDGEYSLEFVKPNYVSVVLRLDLPSTNTLIRLTRYGVIRGRVLDGHGQPIAPVRREPTGRTLGANLVVLFSKLPGGEEL